MHEISNDVFDIIKQNHGEDKKQLEIIVSRVNRLVVEAPAGCGKTTTMVSKIAYMLANNTIPKNKKILTLTFSVNAAYKMKKDISEKLPKMGLNTIQSPNDLNDFIYISNYHGLCRRILKLYGYLFDERLKDINDFKVLNEPIKKDEQKKFFSEYDINISDNELDFFYCFHNKILSCDENEVIRLENTYCDILKNKFIEKKCITYNGYLILARRILTDNVQLLSFFQKLYPVVIIDEFQDTNVLSWNLICLLLSSNTKCFFMGDSLQRIYGFIGAIPDLLSKAVDKFQMEKIVMTTNYRFKNNPQMLLLDKNIIENAKNPKKPNILQDAIINLKYNSTHEEETEWVVNTISDLQFKSSGESVVILVQQRGPGITTIIKKLEDNHIDFFFALFTDEDEEYIMFHRNALRIFNQILDESNFGRVNKTILNKVYRKLKDLYSEKDRLVESLIMLVEVFFERVCVEYKFLDNSDKIAFIRDTFENRALKQNMDLIKSNLFISTVHGAKGLEWDNVLIPDLEPYCFPNFSSLCGECIEKKAKYGNVLECRINPKCINEKKYIEELSIFYVAVTRVRKKLFFSASGDRKNARGEIKSSKISCLAFLPGIKIKYLIS